jgi:hypothetical protein
MTCYGLGSLWGRFGVDSLGWVYERGKKRVGLERPARIHLWHFLSYNPPTDQEFISYTGHLLAPPLTKAGTYYLWPGLQATDHSGVFQPVLDGRTGGWYFGGGWCCSNPSWWRLMISH